MEKEWGEAAVWGRGDGSSPCLCWCDAEELCYSCVLFRMPAPLSCPGCHDLDNEPLPPSGCSWLLCPSKLSTQVDAETFLASGFFLQYSWKGASQPDWTPGDWQKVYDVLQSSGCKFFLWCLVWFVATILQCLLEKTRILGRAVSFVPQRYWQQVLQVCVSFPRFQESPTWAGRGRSLFCDRFGVSDLQVFLDQYLALCLATVVSYLLSKQRAACWMGFFEEARGKSQSLQLHWFPGS